MRDVTYTVLIIALVLLVASIWPEDACVIQQGTTTCGPIDADGYPVQD